MASTQVSAARSLLGAGIVAAMLCAGFLLGALLLHSAAAPDRPQPGIVDIGFAQHMSKHHDQAVLLVSLFLHGHETPLEPFARRMLESQLVELGQMRGWLSLWDKPLAPRREAMDWMLAGSTPPDETLRAYLLDCQAAPGGMPGLAGSADLQALQQARGGARDRLFLELMQRHHEGGLPMLDFAAREARLPAVSQLAERMLVEQLREVARMRGTLNASATVLSGVASSDASRGAGPR